MEWRAKAEERLEWTVEQFAQRLITLAEAEEILWQLQEEGHYDLDFIQPLLVYLNQLQASHAAFAAGNSFFEQGDYLRALDEYAKVREDDLNYAAAQTRAAEALQAFRDMHLAEVDLAVENKDYATAVQILENALAQREDLVLREELSAVVEYWHQHDLEQLARAHERFNRREKTYEETLEFVLNYQPQSVLDTWVFDELFEQIAILRASQHAFDLGEEYFAAGLYPAAVEQYQLVVVDDVNFEEAMRKSDLAKIGFVKAVSGDVAAAAAKGDYAAAFTIVQGAQNELDLPELHHLFELLLVEEEQYAVEEALAVAWDAFELDGNYLAAQKVILQCLDQFPENQLLQEELAFFKQFEPVLLAPLNPVAFEGGGLFYNGNNPVTDNTGRRHPLSSCIRPNFWSDSWLTAVTYMLRGAYTDFTGTIVVDQGSRSNTNPMTVRILGDGEVLLEVQNIRRGFLPQPFHLDVTGVQQLTIEFERLYKNEPKVWVARMFLAKSYPGFPTSLDYSKLYFAVEPQSEGQEERDFVDGVLKAADLVFKPNGDFFSAINIIREGLGKYRDNARLAEALAYYESYRPVSLFDMVDFYIVEYSLDFSWKHFTTILGITHRPNEYGYLQYGRNGKQAYYLGGEYTDFYGTITLGDSYYRPAKDGDYFRVFGDGQLLYEAGSTPSTFCDSFHIDVTGVEVLVIEYGCNYSSGPSIRGPVLVRPHVVKSYTGFPYTGRK